jgi:IS5 family transposase
MRCSIRDTAKLCTEHNIKGWRQSKHHISTIKALLRKASKIKRSTSKCEEKKQYREELLKQIYQSYIDQCNSLVQKIKSSLIDIKNKPCKDFFIGAKIELINVNITHAERQLDQLNRRVILGETIPHAEKKFSIFEGHTEWISKGKVGVPVEFGLKVCVFNDQYGFVLNHKICQKESDSDIAIQMHEGSKEKYKNIESLSFDKGFSTKENKLSLEGKVEKLIMPKKGKLSEKDREEQNEKDFIKYRKKHSAVESDINSLEHHGFNKCRNKGFKGFQRHISLSVLSYNLHKLGALIQARDLKKLQKQKARPRPRLTA